MSQVFDVIKKRKKEKKLFLIKEIEKIMLFS